MAAVAYDDLLASVEAGRLVAVAPAIDDDGKPSLVIVSGELPPLHRMYMAEATGEQRARIAVRAIRQVREHYGIADC